MNQPTVAAELDLLDQGYPYGDLLLDLYGELDADGYNVCDATLSGTQVSLFDLLSGAVLKAMTDRCNEMLPSYEQTWENKARAAAKAMREVRILQRQAA